VPKRAGDAKDILLLRNDVAEPMMNLLKTKGRPGQESLVGWMVIERKLVYVLLVTSTWTRRTAGDRARFADEGARSDRAAAKTRHSSEIVQSRARKEAVSGRWHGQADSRLALHSKRSLGERAARGQQTACPCFCGGDDIAERTAGHPQLVIRNS